MSLAMNDACRKGTALVLYWYCTRAVVATSAHTVCSQNRTKKYNIRPLWPALYARTQHCYSTSTTGSSTVPVRYLVQYRYRMLLATVFEVDERHSNCAKPKPTTTHSTPSKRKKLVSYGTIKI